MYKPLFNATVLVRLAIAVGFLSAVADRFGGWGLAGEPTVAWGNWTNFLVYTGSLTGWLTTNPSLLQALAVAATGLELLLGLFLLLGYQTRVVAYVSGLLLLSFAVSMTISSSSFKVAFDYSVYTASAAAFLLASAQSYPYSVDDIRRANSSRRR